MKPTKRTLLLILITMTISIRSSWEEFTNSSSRHSKHLDCNNCFPADNAKIPEKNCSIGDKCVKTDKATTNSTIILAESRIYKLRSKRHIHHNHHRWHHERSHHNNRIRAPNVGSRGWQKPILRSNVINHRSNLLNKRQNVMNKRLKVIHDRRQNVYGRGIHPQNNRHALIQHHHQHHHRNSNLDFPETLSTTTTPRETDQTTTRPDSDFLPDINLPICGLREAENRQIFQRIVGGKEAEPFSWPWVVALYRVTFKGGQSFKGAGSLINKRFVLTAAHLVTPEDIKSSLFVVRVGTHMSTDSAEDFAEYAYTVMAVIQHPMYLRGQYYNDIALLKLKPRVTFGELVAPVCLPLADLDLTGRTVTVTGWGDQTFGGVSSRQLREASFHVQSRESCNASYIKFATRRFPQGITENMLCAGGGGKDACQGDSGGPLTILEDGRVVQVGIVSFGYECGNDSFPGVYTKVAPYMPWIAKYCH